MIYKKDKNHESIEFLFQQYGYITIDTSWSRGKLLDFIAYKLNGKCWFIEVKNGKKPLTKDEEIFISKHPERSVVLRSIEEAKRFLAHVEAIF